MLVGFTFRSRARACTAPLYGGKLCEGEGEQMETCSEAPCPGDFGFANSTLIDFMLHEVLLEWTSWSTWGSCSKTCGWGQRGRVRILLVALKLLPLWRQGNAWTKRLGRAALGKRVNWRIVKRETVQVGGWDKMGTMGWDGMGEKVQFKSYRKGWTRPSDWSRPRLTISSWMKIPVFIFWQRASLSAVPPLQFWSTKLHWYPLSGLRGKSGATAVSLLHCSDFHFVSQTWTTLISTQWTPAGSPGESGAIAVSRAAMGTGTEVEDAQVVEESLK